MEKIESYSRKIIELIDLGKISTKSELHGKKLELAKFFGLNEMPSNPTIMGFCKNPSKNLESLLSIKPVRNLSGVAVVAVMTKPFDCVGKCIYCPSSQVGRKTPKSYTGKEPATMRGLMFDFDAFRQVSARVKQFEETGHEADKIELIAMGGTFLSHPLKEQEKFVMDCFNAVTGKKAKSVESAKKFAEVSEKRIIGFTFETRPDWCSEKIVDRMLEFGGTRCELGVQILSDKIYEKINRGHTVKDVVDATRRLKDSAFKVCYHFMPGLPESNPKLDVELFKKAFEEQEFMPDMIKIYPCLVVKGTKLYEMWQNGEYKPYSTEEAVEVITEFKKIVPKYVRIMRIQRDIPSTLIEGGVKKTNIRQLVGKKLKEKGIECNCIRCREAGLKEYMDKIEPKLENAKILVEKYNASNGLELFVSIEDPEKNSLFGFGRLRIPWKPFRKEIDENTALLRELHVYGSLVPIGKNSENAIQHKGIGKKIVMEIERIAKEDFDKKKLLVISGIGVKEYYKKMGFENDGPYVSKKL